MPLPLVTSISTLSYKKYTLSRRTQRWRRWQADHLKQPKTLNAYVDVGGRLVVSEEAWAEELSFGALVLAGVPVMEAGKAEIPSGEPEFEATLGLAAIERFDLVVDGKQGVAYVRPKKTSPPVYKHNCLGAVFGPTDLLDPASREFVARVVDGSPAYEAGIRNGDLLRQIDASQWNADPTGIPIFWTPTNGTRLTVTVKRGRRTLIFTAVLRQILVSKAGNQSKVAHD
jgi:hypothetical protein